MTRRKISVVLICLVLMSMITVRGQFVEGKKILRENNNQSVSLSEDEIAEEVNKKMRSAFLENQGQVGNEEIIFYGSLPNGKIGFGESKVMLWMEGMNSIVSLNFVGARKIFPIGVDELVTKSNYFLGDRGTYTNVRSFEAILYDELWKGIDLYYQATPKGAKYEFRVAPGANPKDININCEGQEQLIIGKDSLTILKGDGRFVDEGLKVYQDGMEIDARFVNKGDNTFGFQVNKYDENKPMVIDPLLYSTFVGESESDWRRDLALDNEGNVYVTGWTMSSNFPTTENAYDRTLSGGGDCFIFKLSANGSSLLYSTFFGGSLCHEYGMSIALDSEGNAYVTGQTASSDFPTTAGAYDESYNGVYSASDCFVFKLSANGSSLLYSTFVGGNRSDSGHSIALDSEGIAYVMGYTYSSNFPTTINAYDESHNGDWDCFVFKLSANGSSLLYSTFIGGNLYDRGDSIALDSEGNAYMTGITQSSDFPTTENAYNRTHGGESDCFVFKLSADGSSLLYSTFVGGNHSDQGRSIVLDNVGNAYVTGGAWSSDFPTTENAYNRTHDGESDCFVFKLSADGSSLLYSTFIGRSNDDFGASISLDSERNVYVTGRTWSSNFPTTAGAYNELYNGGDGDCFVFKLAANGSSLLYSTFVGGSDRDWGDSIALDNEGNAYVAGSTHSSDFPTSENAYDRTHGGVSDCFVFMLLTEAEIPSTPTPTPTPIPTVQVGIYYLVGVTLVFTTAVLIVFVRRKRK